MDDLVCIPFVRENITFKQFLEFEANYQEDSNFDMRRTIIQQKSSGSILVNNLTSQGGRQSVINPFNLASASG